VLLHDPHADDGQRERIGLRLNVWRRRTRLDAALADGADPAGDPALSLRAHQLTQASTTSAIANTIRKLLDAAEEPPAARGREGPRPPLRREAVLAAREPLLVVADELRRPEAVAPQAVALAARLVWDSASPLYATSGVSVERWADAVIRAAAR